MTRSYVIRAYVIGFVCGFVPLLTLWPIGFNTEEWLVWAAGVVVIVSVLLAVEAVYRLRKRDSDALS